MASQDGAWPSWVGPDVIHPALSLIPHWRRADERKQTVWKLELTCFQLRKERDS